MALVINNGDVVGLFGGLVVQGRDVQDTIGINVKGNFNLRNTMSMLSFVHLNKHARLVVRVHGEDFRFLVGMVVVLCLMRVIMTHLATS